MQKKIIAGLVILLVIAAGAFFFFKKGGSLSMGPDYTGKRVTVDYIGSYPDGKVFDTNLEEVAKQNAIYTPSRPYTPLAFVVGSNDVIPGFGNAVNGMKIGETKKVTVEPKDGYGEYDATKTAKVPRSVFQEANIVPEIGQSYNMGGQPIVVKELTDTEVTVDINHPMAGKTLVFEITLKTVEN